MQCPVCRAGVDQGPACRRCRADLSLLFQLETQRERVLAAAHRCAARGQWRQALALANGADALRRGDDAERFLALCHLLEGDFAQAWQCYAARFLSAIEHTSTETSNVLS